MIDSWEWLPSCPPQQPPSNFGSLTHLMVFQASYSNSLPSKSVVTLFTHQPPFDTLTIRDPMNKTRVIWMHVNEHFASPSNVLLCNRCASMSVGYQIATIITRHTAEIIMEASEESGMLWFARSMSAVTWAAMPSTPNDIPIIHEPIFSALHGND